jgi:mannobiose 2-epimerase
MIYSFALGYRVTGQQRYLAHAAQGLEFLRRHFRDDVQGGWLRTTTVSGDPINRDKWPYGLSFVSFALADFWRASGEQLALSQSIETYGLLRRHAWDDLHGGLYSNLSPDWSPTDTSKRLDGLLHAMEAASSLLAATGEPRYLADLQEYAETIISHTVSGRESCLLEWSTRDWREREPGSAESMSYGHLLGAAWFILALGGYSGNQQQLESARSILDYTLRAGWDDADGGFYASGHCAAGAQSLIKVWWVQAEGLGALSLAYRLTGQAVYLTRLRALADFIYRRLRDPRDGEWYAWVGPDGGPRGGEKGSAAKGAYHVVQALYHADRNLTLVQAAESARAAESGPGWEAFAL